MSNGEPRRPGTLGLRAALIGIVLLAMIFTLYRQGRRITVLEEQRRQDNRAKVQQINTINKMNMSLNKRFDAIEKKVAASPSAGQGSVPGSNR